MNMKVDRKELLIDAIVIILLSLIKGAFVTIDEELSFFALFRSYYIRYGDISQFNIIWLAPLLVTIFFITKSTYLKLMNFNIRYHNRKISFIKIVQHLLLRTIIYGLLSIILPLPVLLDKVNFVVELNIDIFLFVLKYIIELLAISTIILLFAFLIRNYTYCFSIVLVIIIFLLTKFKVSYLPFITLYVSDEINIFSIMLIILNVGTLFYSYLKRDVLKGVTK